LNSCGEFLDFRLLLKISAFLFEALIFFVSFFYQEKKEIRDFPITTRCLQMNHLIQLNDI